jgi:hypothetical protein
VVELASNYTACLGVFRVLTRKTRTGAAPDIQIHAPISSLAGVEMSVN